MIPDPRVTQTIDFDRVGPGFWDVDPSSAYACRFEDDDGNPKWHRFEAWATFGRYEGWDNVAFIVTEGGTVDAPVISQARPTPDPTTIDLIERIDVYEQGLTDGAPPLEDLQHLLESATALVKAIQARL